MNRPARPAPRTGPDEDEYWQYAARGELRLQQCADCAEFRYPPSAHCPRCLSRRHTWLPLSKRGRLMAWTTFHRQYFPEFPPPYVVASVATDEGPLVIGNLVGASEPVHGMRLAAIAEPVLLDGKPGHVWQWTPLSADHDNQQGDRP